MPSRHAPLVVVLMTQLLAAATLPAQQQQTSAVRNSAAATPNLTEQDARGRAAGDSAAKGVPTGGWSLGGFVLGIYPLPLIGPAALYAIAAKKSSRVPADQQLAMANELPVYQQAYETAYDKRLSSRRRASVLKGGLISTAIIGALVVALLSGGMPSY